MKMLHSLVTALFLMTCFVSLAAFAQDGRLVIPAQSFTYQGSGSFPMPYGLGIRPKAQGDVEISTLLPIGNSRFDIVFHAMSDPNGESEYEVVIGTKTIGKFKSPKSESGEVPYIKKWKKVYINEGEKLYIRTRNNTLDGKVYSTAQWAKIEFIPLDIDPGKMKAILHSARHQDVIEAGPKLAVARQANGNGNVAISGELKQWHPVTLTLNGPFAHEQDIEPNAFLDYRMSVTFSHESGKPSYTVPGYFAADGNAAESSADMGTAWRAHLSPDKTGTWSYRVSFVSGEDASIDPKAGTYLKPYHGKFGTFEVKKTDKKGNDFRAKGRLEYVGSRYLRHAGTGEVFLKAGPDAPETILAYADFDNTINMKANLPLKTWAPHAQDFNEGDPTWQNGKGQNLIGAMNYLAKKRVNAFSFLTYNAGGDGDNIWPYVERNGKLHFDASKLDQWNIVFSHAQNVGVFLHFKLQENELDDNRKRGKIVNIEESMDGGLLGTERKLYLREIIARFSHHLALNWNLGEENTQSDEEQRDMAGYVYNVDPYKHTIVIHSFPGQQDEVYLDLLGSQSTLMGASLQNNWSTTHKDTKHWVELARAAGKPWVVANDEQNPAGTGVPPDVGYKGFDGWAPDGDIKYNMHDIRKYTLWGNLMAGGAGVEYYFGYRLLENDLNAEDWRSRDKSWEYAGIAIDFFMQNKVPVQRMRNLNELVDNTTANNSKYCFGNEGEIYLVYLPKGGTSQLDLSHEGSKTKFKVRWFNPRTGGKLIKGSVKKVSGGSRVELGSAPSDANEDWLVVVRR